VAEQDAADCSLPRKYRRDRVSTHRGCRFFVDSAKCAPLLRKRRWRAGGPALVALAGVGIVVASVPVALTSVGHAPTGVRIAVTCVRIAVTCVRIAVTCVRIAVTGVRIAVTCVRIAVTSVWIAVTSVWIAVTSVWIAVTSAGVTVDSVRIALTGVGVALEGACHTDIQLRLADTSSLHALPLRCAVPSPGDDDDTSTPIALEPDDTELEALEADTLGADEEATRAADVAKAIAAADLRGILRALTAKACALGAGPARAEDCAQQAVTDLLENKVRWDPTRGSLVGFLIVVVRSRVLHAFEHDAASPETEPDSERDGNVPRSEPNVEAATLLQDERDDSNGRFKQLMAEVKDMPDAVAVVRCIQKEIDKPADQEELLGIPKRRITTARQAVARAIKRVYAKLPEAPRLRKRAPRGLHAVGEQGINEEDEENEKP